MKVRKKPGELEAFRFDPSTLDIDDADAVPEWFRAAAHNNLIEPAESRSGEPILIIHDPVQGDMIVHDGDWVMYGIEGNLYPTTDSIFQKTYEEIKG